MPICVKSNRGIAAEGVVVRFWIFASDRGLQYGGLDIVLEAESIWNLETGIKRHSSQSF